MTQTNRPESRHEADSSTGFSEGAFSQEKRAAEGLVDDVKTAASEAGSRAKTMASEKADELQGAAAGQLRLFADAVRTAGDELAEKEPGPISDLVRQAAEGLEQFSGALGRKSSAEMIAGVRDFGRQNPVGFLAGSMLAGFALARFAGSASPPTSPRSSERLEAQTRKAFSEEGGADGDGTTHTESFDPAPPRDASSEGTWRTDV